MENKLTEKIADTFPFINTLSEKDRALLEGSCNEDNEVFRSRR